MKIGQYFHLDEFLRSETAARTGKVIRRPSAEIEDNLRRLCDIVLDPLRIELGESITILSGYRPVWLNVAVKGSKNSDHLFGRAADIIATGYSNPEVCRIIQKLRLPVKQCILEFPPKGWVHVSIEKEFIIPRREMLTAKKRLGKTVYYPGIVV